MRLGNGGAEPGGGIAQGIRVLMHHVTGGVLQRPANVSVAVRGYNIRRDRDLLLMPMLRGPHLGYV